jgi:hydrogenase nickel incorporation protein HypA/HybF
MVSTYSGQTRPFLTRTVRFGTYRKPASTPRTGPGLPPLEHMHELPATQGMLDVALEAAAAAGARRISAVDVVIGDLSSMVDDSVQFYFDLLSRGTPAAGALLRMRRIRARAECAACGGSYDVTPPLDPACAECGQLAIRVTGGQEFYIESIEVDE